MSAAVISTEWLNQNSLRNYPFREDCGLRPNDSAGNLIEDGWRVPNYLITDFVISVNGSKYDPTLFLKRLSVINRSLTLVFADTNGDDAFTVGVAPEEDTKLVSGVGNFEDSKGVMRFGDLNRFFEETPDGLYTFNKEESLIEPTCIRPSVSGVRSIAMVDNSGYTTGGLKGDVKIVAGENIHLVYDIATNAIIVNASSDSGYTDECECEKDDTQIVKTINGIGVENIIIEGDDCIQISADENTGILTIKDTCSKPCCGCAETAFINQTINDLQSSVNTLTTNAAILSDRITTFVNNYLLARKTLP